MHSELQRGREVPSRYISMVTHCTALRARANVILKSTLNLAILNHAFRSPSITFQSDDGLRSYVPSTATNIVTSFASTVSATFFSLSNRIDGVSGIIRCDEMVFMKTVFRFHCLSPKTKRTSCNMRNNGSHNGCLSTTRAVNVFGFRYYVVSPGSLVILFILKPGGIPLPIRTRPQLTRTSRCTVVVKNSGGNLVGYSSKVLLYFLLSFSLPLFSSRAGHYPSIYRNVLRYSI